MKVVVAALAILAASSWGPATAQTAPPDLPATTLPDAGAPAATDPMAGQQAPASRDAAVPKRLHAKKVVKPKVNQLRAAERAGYKKVSDLVNFPTFFPGLGIVTVKPSTLPVGPFRTFDRKGKLIATVYMLPLKDMNDQKRWDYVKGLPAPADHATFYYHPGHAGVEMPHYHLVIWHVSRKNEALVAK